MTYIHPAEVIYSLQNGIIISLPLRNVFELLLELSHNDTWVHYHFEYYKKKNVIFSFFFYRYWSL